MEAGGEAVGAEDGDRARAVEAERAEVLRHDVVARADVEAHASRRVELGGSYDGYSKNGSVGLINFRLGYRFN